VGESGQVQLQPHAGQAQQHAGLASLFVSLVYYD
jgi:hypothetical protein